MLGKRWNEAAPRALEFSLPLAVGAREQTLAHAEIPQKKSLDIAKERNQPNSQNSHNHFQAYIP